MRHQWRDEDDAALEDVIVEIGDRLPKTVRYWSAVAGAMLLRRQICVSADACRSRAEKLARDKREREPAAVDAWAQAAQRVEQYEADQWDYAIEALRGLRDAVTAIDTRLAAIEQEQVRLRRLWE